MKSKHFTSKNKDKRGNKDWRNPYVGKEKVKNFDWSCRHGGGCSYCEEGRKFRNKRQEANTESQLDD